MPRPADRSRRFRQGQARSRLRLPSSWRLRLHIDGDPGVARLYPVQSGRVVEVAKEGAHVKKGEPLLKMDDEFARRKLDEARAEPRQCPGRRLTQAKTLPAQTEEKLIRRESAVKAAQKAAYEAADSRRQSKERTARKTGVTTVNKETLEAAKQMVEQGPKLLIQAEDREAQRAQAVRSQIRHRPGSGEFGGGERQDRRGGIRPHPVHARRPVRRTRPAHVHVNPGEVYGPTAAQPRRSNSCPAARRSCGPRSCRSGLRASRKASAMEIVDDTHAAPKWKREGSTTSRSLVHAEAKRDHGAVLLQRRPLHGMHRQGRRRGALQAPHRAAGSRPDPVAVTIAANT